MTKEPRTGPIFSVMKPKTSNLATAALAAALYRAFWLVSWLAAAYMRPYLTVWIQRRGANQNLKPLAAANLLLGWTVVGWLALLLLAKARRSE